MARARSLPPFDASTVEMVCRALAEAVTGVQIPNLLVPLKVQEEPGALPAKWKRLFNAVATAQNTHQHGGPLVRLVTDVMKPVRFESPEIFEAHRSAVNERLLLSGLEILDDGRVGTAKPATTLAEAQERTDKLRAELVRRNVHSEVLHFCQQELLQHNYFHAVLEASKSVFQRLRDLTGLQSDGSGLVDATCSVASGPLLAFNSLETEWERSEQNGLVLLMKGVASTFRNPVAHAPKVLWVTEQADAVDMLTLASMLHRRLDAAVVRDRS